MKDFAINNWMERRITGGPGSKTLGTTQPKISQRKEDKTVAGAIKKGKEHHWEKAGPLFPHKGGPER